MSPVNRYNTKMQAVPNAATPQALLRQEVLALHAYHVPPVSGMIKLDAMENPYSLPQELAQEIARLVMDAPLNRYPDAAARSLKEKIRAVARLPEGMDVLLGNGSDEIIQLLALALNKPGAVLLGVEPSFVMYKMIAMFTGMQYVGVPLTEDFELDLAATLAAIRRHQPALVFLAYPNNPTGNVFDAAAVAQIIEAAPGLVVVDEAYLASLRGRIGDRLLEALDTQKHPKQESHSLVSFVRLRADLELPGLRMCQCWNDEHGQHQTAADQVRESGNHFVLLRFRSF